MDISMGNWILRPMVSSRKNSRNQSWERSQHCCRASEQPAGGAKEEERPVSDIFLNEGKKESRCDTEHLYPPLKFSKCVKKKDCLWKSSMATTIGPSRLLRRVFFEPLLSAISDSSMVRTIYSCTDE